MVEEFIRRFNLGEQPCYLMLPLIISLDMTSSIYTLQVTVLVHNIYMPLFIPAYMYVYMYVNSS